MEAIGTLIFIAFIIYLMRDNIREGLKRDSLSYNVSKKDLQEDYVLRFSQGRLTKKELMSLHRGKKPKNAPITTDQKVAYGTVFIGYIIVAIFIIGFIAAIANGL